jgi:hypothetical protein
MQISQFQDFGKQITTMEEVDMVMNLKELVLGFRTLELNLERR